jgi:NAD(P)-dependent dehydrogenase (short-subunit alcohol dehydrogenase family)
MNGKTAVVTGGSRGLGKAVARVFADAGARVFICAREADELDAAVADIDGDVTGVRADVRDEFDVERLMETAAKGADGIDVLVANAGTIHGSPGGMPIDDESYTAFDDTLRTNVRGVFSTVKEALPHMTAEGRVLVPSGSVAHDAKAGMGGYAVSKAAAEAVARGFAVDVEQTVGVVDPGLAATELTGGQGRDPADLAPMYLWAATELDVEELDGERVSVKQWKQATR